MGGIETIYLEDIPTETIYIPDLSRQGAFNEADIPFNVSDWAFTDEA